MNQRLRQFIKSNTRGNYSDFARKLGWTPQYLNRLLKNGSIGIKPILTILGCFPELNARWFLLGEGPMLDSQNVIEAHIRRALEIEPYSSVMSPYQVKKYVAGSVDFTPDEIEEWKEALAKNEPLTDD